MELICSALKNLNRVAVVTEGGSYRYSDIISGALRACSVLQNVKPRPPSPGTPAFPAAAFLQPRIGVLCEPGPEYVSSTLGTWLACGISVPLGLSHPDRELTYVLEDSGASAVLATPSQFDRARRVAHPLGTEVHRISMLDTLHSPGGFLADGSKQRTDVSDALQSVLNPDNSNGKTGALILYTSGTTGRPKGALHTHGSLGAQIHTLCSAWEWSSSDRILHTLPLHHTHGIVNALFCALASGAAVEFLPKFSPNAVWQCLKRTHDPVTIFMGVPTMYSFLLDSLRSMHEEDERKKVLRAAGQLRLAVSGSAACPIPLMKRWQESTGGHLLERYGMTETGMLLGNPLRGERKIGTVGLPFEGVEVRVSGDGAGELAVRSAQLFEGYWGRPEATASAFDPGGWFLTGDTVAIDADGYFRILGRSAVDLIKHGGYKISALDIEAILLEHPAVEDCAVVGLPDETYGEVVAAVVVVAGGAPRQLEIGEATKGGDAWRDDGIEQELRKWSSERMAPYQVPKCLRVVHELPRNAMGKVNKKALRAQIFPELFAP